jgi:hypothetical protein
MTSEIMGTNDKLVVEEDTSPQDVVVYDDNDPSLAKDSMVIPPVTPPPPSPTKHHSSLSSSFAVAFAPIIDMDGTTVLITKTHKVLDFISALLFCIGSVFYMKLRSLFGSANNDGGLEKFTGIRLPVDYANCLHGSRATFSAGLPLTVEKFMSAYSKALSQVLRKYNRPQDQVKVSVMWKEVMDLIPPNLQIHTKESASALLSVLVHFGEMLLLEGGVDGAYIIAHTILATDVKSGGIDSVVYNSHLRDLMSSGDNLREITKFYHTRSGCHCLEETYAHLRRTDEKQGLCYQCQSRNERKKLFVCAQCRIAQYCSTDCQRLHWPSHKDFCNLTRAAQRKT